MNNTETLYAERELATTKTKEPWKLVGLFILLWIVVSLVSALNFYYWPLLRSGIGGGGRGLAIVIVSKLVVWLIWGVIALLIIRIGRRILFKKIHWISWFFKHLTISLALTSSYIVVYSFALMLIWDDPITWSSLLFWFYTKSGEHMSYYYLAYWFIIGTDYAINYYRRSTDQERQLSEARLTLLKSQLQPHFLFNSMHMIISLIGRDPEKAKEMLEKLSDLLRISLEQFDGHETTLETELDFTTLYLEIQERRFHDRLKVFIRVPDELHQTLVPFLTLQTLVENAIKHGVSPNSNCIELTLSASSTDGFLNLSVEDSGPGFTGELHDRDNRGIGLSNLRQRLSHLYGESFSMKTSRVTEGGARIDVSLPLKVSD